MNASVYTAVEGMATGLGLSTGIFWALFVIVAIWTIVFKGFALWHAARNYQRRWFIALLVLNTFGLLEIVYLIWFRKDRHEGRTGSLFNAPAGPAEA